MRIVNGLARSFPDTWRQHESDVKMSDQKTIGGRIKSLFISEEGIIFTILNMLMITFAAVMVWALSKAG